MRTRAPRRLVLVLILRRTLIILVIRGGVLGSALLIRSVRFGVKCVVRLFVGKRSPGAWWWTCRRCLDMPNTKRTCLCCEMDWLELEIEKT